MMEKEAYSDMRFDSYGGAEMASTKLDDVRDEEKKLNRDSNLFMIVGLVTLAAAGILMLPAGLLAQGFMAAMLGIGIAGATFGFAKILKETNRRSLSFPKLKIKRKSNKMPISRPFEETSYIRKQLKKSQKNKVFFGVAGGIAEFAGIPPTVMRLIFILAFFFTGGAVVFPYFLLAIFMSFGRRMERKRGRRRA